MSAMEKKHYHIEMVILILDIRTSSVSIATNIQVQYAYFVLR